MYAQTQPNPKAVTETNSATAVIFMQGNTPKSGQCVRTLTTNLFLYNGLSRSNIQRLSPVTDSRNGLLTIEQLTLNDLAGGGYTDLQFFNCLAELTTTGSCKQDDFLSGEIVTLQKGVDDAGGAIPPDRKS